MSRNFFKPQAKHAEALLRIPAWILLGSAWILLLSYHVLIVRFPYCFSPFESTLTYCASLMALGKNPYAFETQPATANLYGWLMPSLAYLLGKLGLALNLQLLRGINALGVLGASLLMGKAFRRLGLELFASLGLCLLFYGAEIFYVGSSARADGLGIFLFLLSVLLPWFYEFSWPSILAGLFFGLLAFYLKSYLVLALAILGGGIFLKHGVKRSVLFAAIAFFFLGGSALEVQALCPAYFYETLLVHAQTADRIWGYMAHQLVSLFFLFALLPALALLWASRSLARLRREDLKYFGAAFLFGLLLFVFVFGPSLGAYMTYALQLVFPFLLLLGAMALSECRWPLWAFSSALILNALLLGHELVDPMVLQSSQYRQEWEEEASFLAPYSRAFVSNLEMPILMAQNKAIFDDGHTSLALESTAPPALLQPLFPDFREMEEANARYMKGLKRLFDNGYFQIAIVSSDEIYVDALIGRKYLLLRKRSIPGLSGPVGEEIWVNRDLLATKPS